MNQAKTGFQRDKEREGGKRRDENKRVQRHGNDPFRNPFRPGRKPRRPRKAIRRTAGLLARVLRQGVPPLPAGTALYARARSRLARQAHGVFAPLGKSLTFEPTQTSRALARPPIARDHGSLPRRGVSAPSSLPDRT